MPRILAAFLLSAAAQGASLTVSLSVTATVTQTAGGNYGAAGTANLTGGITDSGTFSATIPLSAVTATTVNASYTMGLSMGTITGNVAIPVAVLLGSTTSGSGTLTVTTGTGNYANDTGSFNVSGSGGLTASGAISVTLSGSGTITTGGSTPPSGPTITAVQDAGSYTANVAEGGIFVVKGSSMSASGFTEATPPYPTSLGMTSITLTPASGGTGTQALMIYTYSQNGVNQLAGVVPSTVPVGNYNVTVAYNGMTSAPFVTQVVKTKPALLTQDSSGGGLALLQNFVSATQYDVNRLTTGTVNGSTTSPAKPGQTVVAWGSGLGPVPFPDSSPPSSGYSYSNVAVLVGGTVITPAYAGISAYPGLDQINFTLPTNVSTGCAVSLQIQVGNVVSAATTISIAPNPSAPACVYPGLTQQQLQQLDNGGTYTAGYFELEQLIENISGSNGASTSISGSFSQVTGFELGSISSAATSNTNGACKVIQVTVTSSGTPTTGTAKFLDAGKVTVNGPAGSNLSSVAVTETGNLYSAILGGTGANGVSGSPNGMLVPGAYTLAGAGGQDVGSFTTSITLGAPLTIVGGLPTTVTESAGLSLSWTGGNASDLVGIVGYSGTMTGTGNNAVTIATEFICTTTAGAGGFTVPASMLTQLPKSSSIAAGTAAGFLEVISGPSPATFSPALTAGGTVPSTFSAFVGSASTVSYQ